ncbi:MAG TPA: M15 family metallopeptidase [Minicystis sp.]|nr:M15 family metallopeptidase [Minicystis sp.]
MLRSSKIGISVTLAAASFATAAVVGPGAAARADEPPEVACNEQAPLPFLVRKNYVQHLATSPADRAARKAMHQRAIRYRTIHYGYFDGFGDPAWNAKTPHDYAEATRFMGLRVGLSRRIVPAVRCVEREIRATCGGGYRPASLSGIRPNNTFHDGEVSNHVYGIAIDVDPQKNVCCGCVGPAANHPVCRRSSTLEERMAMPACWVRAFEKYGFYWLGHDELEDTMHFEFLGDPSKIVAK